MEVRRYGLGLIMIALLVPAADVIKTARAQDDIDNGRALAIRHCANCHVIGDHNRFGGIGSTPSFQLLASMRDGDARFSTFFARRPHISFMFLPDREPPTDLPLNAPKVRLTYQDVSDIVAFGLTLKDPRLAE